jgi:hypothetical protein
MQRVSSRAAHAILAVAVALLAACGDEVDPVNPMRPARPAFAAGDIYTVTTTSDHGVGSLRWALSFATGGETIRFDPSLAGTVIGVDSALRVTASVTIEGPAGKGIEINGNLMDRVFYITQPAGAVTILRNLQIRGGNTAAAVSPGAGIYASGRLLLENTTVWDNLGSKFGAIYAEDLTLINSTVSGNDSAFPTAAIGATTLKLVNSTIASNVWGGVAATSVTLRNSIIANNGTGYPNCSATTFSYEGPNISNEDTCGGPSVMMIADPLLARLGKNGGPGLTHALLPGSPAINAGGNCSVQVDQRYVARDAQCDLGAFEFIDFTKVTLTIDPGVSVTQADGWAVVTGTVTCTRNETFDVALQLKQEQKAGRTSTVVQGTGTTRIACDTPVQHWSVALAPSTGAFGVGSADAVAKSANTAAWVTPATTSSTVRLFWGRP